MAHLLIGLILFGLALLAVLPVPHVSLWPPSVIAKEWGHVLAILCLPVLYPRWLFYPIDEIGGGLALAAAILFLVPLLSSLDTARVLPEELAAAFGKVPGQPGDRPTPMLWRDLFLGIPLRRMPVETVTYVFRDGRRLKMDVTRPRGGGGAAPMVLVIHGGAWHSGNRKQLPALNRYLAARGYLVAAIDYRLSPGATFPAALNDVLSAVAYLKEHGAALGGDPTRIVTLGRSAGAQLAVLAAYVMQDPAIRGAIAFYGPFDLVWAYSAPGGVLDSPQILRDFLGGSPTDVPEQYQNASPVSCVKTNSPPTLLIHGDADRLVGTEHAIRLAAKLREAGRPHLVVRTPLGTHGSDINLSGPFGQISTYAVEQFLRAVTHEA
ncbi:MAG: alpha/beta hydrolase fold domain-containing protein [Mycobacterium leprae]